MPIPRTKAELTQIIDTRAISPVVVITYLAEISLAIAKKDHEHAHSLEDALYRHLVEAISLGKCKQVEECATLALSTQEMNFERWCS